MHRLRCSLFVVIVCTAYCQDLAGQAEIPDRGAETSASVPTIENDINLNDGTDYTVIKTSIDALSQDQATSVTLKPENLKETAKDQDVNFTTDFRINVKSGQKRDVENVTFNGINPFLLFPLLPFLLPPAEDESLTSERDEFLNSKKNTSKIDGKPESDKPFIFFDFAFIRRTPFNNNTEKVNNTKIIQVKKDDETKENSMSRRRRNTKARMETPGFFDDSPLFPDSELEEFLPKPEMLFSDLPFHRKSFKKLSRRKRDQKKSDLKNDLKFFFDAFDDAFMRTKRELERTDPILNFLRGGGHPLDEEKKEDDDLFSQFPDVQPDEKPRMKWRIQRNIKRLNSDRKDLGKGGDSPMIIVDKVVKIGKFHMHDDEHDKDKLTRKKKRVLGEDNREKVTLSEFEESFPKSLFELIKKEEVKRNERNQPWQSEQQTFTEIQPKEIRILPQMNTSSFNKNRSEIELDKQAAGFDTKEVNSTEKFKYENIKKVIDSLKTKLDLTNMGDSKLRLEDSVHDRSNLQKSLYDEMKKNITGVLNQFLELAKTFDDATLMKKLESDERKNEGVFDWSERETIQKTNIVGKDSKEKREKKESLLENEYMDVGKKEKQFADLSYFFLTVTVPTVFVFALILLACVFSLQAKGKLCSKLFRPRQVFIIEGENPMKLKIPKGTKNYSKVQSI